MCVRVEQDLDQQRRDEGVRRADPLYSEVYRKSETQQARTLHDGTKPYDVAMITRVLLRSSGPMVDLRVFYRYEGVVACEGHWVGHAVFLRYFSPEDTHLPAEDVFRAPLFELHWSRDTQANVHPSALIGKCKVASVLV